jgi:predicted metalloprotease
MRNPIVRTLAVLLVAAGAAGCGDMPMGAAISAVSTQPSLSTGTALTVRLGSCGAYGCSATASGGTGTDYSFTWINAVENNDEDGWSLAYPNCPTGYPLPVYVGVSATVTDSSGATATASKEVYCPARHQPLY